MNDTRDVERRLRLARQVFSPSEAQRERVRSGLAVREALRPDDLARHHWRAPAASARAAAKLGRTRRWMKGAALLGVGFALGYSFAETRGEHPELDFTLSAPSAMVAPAPAFANDPAAAPVPAGRADSDDAPEPGSHSPAIAPSAAAPPAPSASAENSRRSTKRRPRLDTSLPAPSRDAFAEELGLLQRAERAIRVRDGALARSFLSELDVRFPKTAWGQERAAVSVLAACVLDEPNAARGARDFLQQHTESVYFDRIRSSCSIDAAERFR
jgi:hypothetical protein